MVFRQVRPVDRRRIVAAQHHDATFVVLPAQHLGGGKTRRATTDDHDSLWVIGLRDLDRRPLAFLANKNPAVALLHLPDIECVEGRRADRIAGAQIEAGVMPRTPNSAIDNESFSERSVVMAAV